MALCAVALWGVAAGAGPLSGGVLPLPDGEPLRVSLLTPPVLTAAAIDARTPAVYRLPPVNKPSMAAPAEDNEPVDDQLADGQSPVRQRVVSDAAAPGTSAADDWQSLFACLDDPVPEDLDISAGQSTSDAADVAPAVSKAPAPAPRPPTYVHHDMDRPDAADNHLRDVDARSGPGDQPAVEAGVLPYTPTTVELTTQVLPAVQHACGLAQRGATYSAQVEFVKVLRRIAQALDAESDTDEHSRALAAGLRALDEAGDFAPRGTQLEAEVDVRLVASSHRTPVLAGGTVGITPREAAALYLSYAQTQLGRAVTGQQAGSMALHAMGRLECRLARDVDGDVRHTRRAMTMFTAALGACPQNNLAANELGVLLARNGHYAEAEAVFRRAVSIMPTAAGYHNLAVAQQKLGRPQQAIANQQQADRLAAWERAGGQVSQRKGIQWVSPEALARGGQDAWKSTDAVAGAGTPTSDARGASCARVSRPRTAETFGPGGGTVGRPATTTPTFEPPPLAADGQTAVPVRIARPQVVPPQRSVW